MKKADFLLVHLNPDIVTYINDIILQDVNFLIHGCIRKMITIISKDLNDFNSLWICTEMIEKLCEYINFLDLKFTNFFDTTMVQCTHILKKRYPCCEKKFHYWIMIETLKKHCMSNIDVMH